MLLRKWEDIPPFMRNDSVKRYYELLQKKKASLIIKRIFDVIVALLVLIILFPLFVIIGILIRIDSKGPVLFRQVRVGQYGKRFKILKFRTMVNDAETMGSQITIEKDKRITRLGRFLRKYRLDELPQLINIIKGDMSFVGTRPEVERYVNMYTDEMMATLLLPAGVTSKASIAFKDEETLLKNMDNVDEIYINEIIPQKMRYNLMSLEKFSFAEDMKTLINTVVSIIK